MHGTRKVGTSNTFTSSWWWCCSCAVQRFGCVQCRVRSCSPLCRLSVHGVVQRSSDKSASRSKNGPPASRLADTMHLLPMHPRFRENPERSGARRMPHIAPPAPPENPRSLHLYSSTTRHVPSSIVITHPFLPLTYTDHSKLRSRSAADPTKNPPSPALQQQTQPSIPLRPRSALVPHSSLAGAKEPAPNPPRTRPGSRVTVEHSTREHHPPKAVLFAPW